MTRFSLCLPELYYDRKMTKVNLISQIVCYISSPRGREIIFVYVRSRVVVFLKLGIFVTFYRLVSETGYAVSLAIYSSFVQKRVLATVPCS